MELERVFPSCLLFALQCYVTTQDTPFPNEIPFSMHLQISPLAFSMHALPRNPVDPLLLDT